MISLTDGILEIRLATCPAGNIPASKSPLIHAFSMSCQVKPGMEHRGLLTFEQSLNQGSSQGPDLESAHIYKSCAGINGIHNSVFVDGMCDTIPCGNGQWGHFDLFGIDVIVLTRALEAKKQVVEQRGRGLSPFENWLSALLNPSTASIFR